MRALIVVAILIGPVFAQDEQIARFGTTVVLPTGLRGDIFNLRKGTTRLPDFEKRKPVGTIYTSELNVPPQSFEAGFPGVTSRFEWFGLRYSGRFWIEKPGEYLWSLTSDDGAALWIDDKLVIDNDGQHPPQELTATAQLERGVHRIRVAYFQGPRFDVALVLKVAPPGSALRVFSTNEFKPPPGIEDFDRQQKTASAR